MRRNTIFYLVSFFLCSIQALADLPITKSISSKELRHCTGELVELELLQNNKDKEHLLYLMRGDLNSQYLSTLYVEHVALIDRLFIEKNVENKVTENQFLEEQNSVPRSLFYGVWLRIKRELVGSVELSSTEDSQVEVSVYVASGFSNNGYGSDALRAVLRLVESHLIASFVVMNIPSGSKAALRMAQKNGFIRTRSYPKNGRIVRRFEVGTQKY